MVDGRMQLMAHPTTLSLSLSSHFCAVASSGGAPRHRPLPSALPNSLLNPHLHHLWQYSGCSLSFRRPATRATTSHSASRDGAHSPVRASKSGYSTRRVLPIRALLALSAAAAVVFLRKRRSLQTPKVRGSVAVSQGEGMEKMTRIDAHLHVWASPEEAKMFPFFPGQEPTLPGSANFLLKNMAEAGVDGAVIVQPINHKFDHSYVSSVLKMYPEKFVGMCLADPTEGGGGVKELERLIVKENFSGVRFNPYLWPSGQKMTNEVGKAMFAKAGELRVPVGFMCFKGLMLHVDEIEELCREFPRTTVLMDHLGFCKPPLTEEEAEAWNRLLNLSKYSQVYVKLSAFFRVSREPFPYNDTWPLLKQLLESYGAERLMWGR
ncbi:hypothetical protein KC19_6G196300 [Ceratodon purpureus]|uniref:Amidohydrolase-related domain-containing protein n=1 Tax=Ceratodon purpureus TaxID=3225 RepID=A0A8T0HJE0_CERPU|nr:hypothetical protein KC19_6G196300 [Ceratodon purpureus]